MSTADADTPEPEDVAADLADQMLQMAGRRKRPLPTMLSRNPNLQPLPEVES